MIQRLLAAAFILAGLGLLAYYLSHAPPEPLAVPPASKPASNAVVKVLSVQGSVERRGEGANWTAIVAGQKLAQNEAIRTGDNSSARLDLGESSTVEVGARSEISVRELTHSASRVRVEQGRIAADVPGNAQMTVEAKGTDATAQSSGGEFSVLAADGQLTVASKKGRVRLSAKSKSVELVEGTQATVTGSGDPSAALPIPPSLYLKVAAPEGTQRVKEALVEVTASPGAIISINGVHMLVGPKGKFSGPVSLAEGKNVLHVEATDVLGRHEQRDVPITVKTSVQLKVGRTRWDKAKDAGKTKW